MLGKEAFQAWKPKIWCHFLRSSSSTQKLWYGFGFEGTKHCELYSKLEMVRGYFEYVLHYSTTSYVRIYHVCSSQFYGFTTEHNSTFFLKSRLDVWECFVTSTLAATVSYLYEIFYKLKFYKINSHVLNSAVYSIRNNSQPVQNFVSSCNSSSSY